MVHDHYIRIAEEFTEKGKKVFRVRLERDASHAPCTLPGTFDRAIEAEMFAKTIQAVTGGIIQ